MVAPKNNGGLHEDFSREDEVEGSSDRSFGFVFTGFFTIIGLLPLLSQPRGVRLWALVVGGIFFVPALLFPRALAPLNRLWLEFGALLQRIVSPIVLALLFFFTITPMALLLRLLGKDLLGLRWDADAPSYWVVRQPPGPPPESMRNQF